VKPRRFLGDPETESGGCVGARQWLRGDLKTATELLLDHAARIRQGVEELLERSSMTQMDRDWGSAVRRGLRDV
jgi:hypothetical protein